MGWWGLGNKGTGCTIKDVGGLEEMDCRCIGYMDLRRRDVSFGNCSHLPYH